MKTSLNCIGFGIVREIDKLFDVYIDELKKVWLMVVKDVLIVDDSKTERRILIFRKN